MSAANTTPGAPDANVANNTANDTTHSASEFWASGDFPPHDGVLVDHLIDGRAAMLAMCRAFLSAKSYILLAAWDIRADLEMVRGDDARVGPDGSPEQLAFLASLREEGFSDEALALWTAGRFQVRDVLGSAARRGVKVGVLLWDPPGLGVHITNNTQEQRALLQEAGVDCLLDSSSRKLTHMLEALHQKCAVVDGREAFVGGVDLTLQANGDYDRWDTHAHPPDSPERGSERRASMHPWHDAHLRIMGPAVADIERNIVQRWGEMAARVSAPAWPLTLTPVNDPPREGGTPAQIVRTIPPDTYKFAPHGINTIYQAYTRAVEAARRFIYLESQYFWPEVYRGLDAMFFGGKSEEMTAFIAALCSALDRGVSVRLILPDHPNCGRRYSDGGVTTLHEHAPDAVTDGRLRVYTLGASQVDSEATGGILYRPVYVHAKVGIVDDYWLTVGSANLNNRGFVNDAELNVSVLSQRAATELRVALWAEHTQAGADRVAALHDIEQGLAMLEGQAQENFQRVANRQPLQGHVLPYMTYAQAQARGVKADAEHGWLDAIEGGAGATPTEYRERYL